MAIQRDRHGTATSSVNAWSNTSVTTASAGITTITPPAGALEIRFICTVGGNLKAGAGATASDYPFAANTEYVLPIAGINGIPWNGTNSFTIYTATSGTFSFISFID